MRLYAVTSRGAEATASFASPNIHHCVPPKKVYNHCSTGRSMHPLHGGDVDRRREKEPTWGSIGKNGANEDFI